MAENRKLILQQLRDLGIVRCLISYSGGGDNGQINSVESWIRVGDKEIEVNANDLGKNAMTTEQVVVTQISDRLLGEKTSPLIQRIETLAYELLDEAGVDDWVNNDGGSGTLTVFVEDGKDESGVEYDAGQILIDQDTYVTSSINSTYVI